MLSMPQYAGSAFEVQWAATSSSTSLVQVDMDAEADLSVAVGNLQPGLYSSSFQHAFLNASCTLPTFSIIPIPSVTRAT